MQRRAQQTIGALAIGALGLLAWPAAAYAVTVYDGDDYAYNSGTTQVTACDGEQDGHSVYSDYYASPNGRITTGGGAGTCSSASTNSLTSFNVCEQIPFWPDSCSSRVYL